MGRLALALRVLVLAVVVIATFQFALTNRSSSASSELYPPDSVDHTADVGILLGASDVVLNAPPESGSEIRDDGGGGDPTRASWVPTRTEVGSKRAVLGLATGYNWDVLRPFVISLRRTYYQGAVVLFLNGKNMEDEELLRKLRQYGVQTELIHSEHPYFPEGTPAHAAGLAHPVNRTPTFESSMTLRYPALMLWLRAHRANYTDPLEEKLYPVIENTEYRIGSNWMNSEWIRRHYGHDGVRDMKGYHISCSGTTFGYVDQMIDYLATMTTALTEFLLDRPPEIELNDQPVHNWLLRHFDWGSTLVPLIHGRSPVSTLALRTQLDLSQEENSTLRVLLNEDKSTPSVVHQYDRHEDLYREWVSYYEGLDAALDVAPTS